MTAAWCLKPDELASGRRLVAAVAGSDRDTNSNRRRILLVGSDRSSERAVLRILKKNQLPAECARSASELRKRAARDDLRAPEVIFLDLELADTSEEESVSLVRGRFVGAAVVALAEDLSGERAARLLGVGIPSLRKPVSAIALAELAVQLCALHVSVPEAGPANPESERTSALELALESYAAVHALSDQQRLILGLYLCGENDKQIAQTISCSESTVYEHWRRMGRKAGGSTKADVVTDFHRFLVRVG